MSQRIAGQIRQDQSVRNAWRPALCSCSHYPSTGPCILTQTTPPALSSESQSEWWSEEMKVKWEKKRKDRDFGDWIGEIGGRITEQRRLKGNGHGGWQGTVTQQFRGKLRTRLSIRVHDETIEDQSTMCSWRWSLHRHPSAHSEVTVSPGCCSSKSLSDGGSHAAEERMLPEMS